MAVGADTENLKRVPGQGKACPVSYTHLLTLPQNLTISVQNGQGNWIKVKEFSNELPASASNVKLTWDSDVDHVQLVEADATKLYTGNVRLEFDVPEGGDTVYVDEVKIMGKLGKCSDAAEPVSKDESGAYNLALYALSLIHILWKMLIDLELTKKEFSDKVDISMSTIKRMAKNEYVSLKIIDEICDKLECTPDDVMYYIPNSKENK